MSLTQDTAAKRSPAPRIPPLAEARWNVEQRSRLEPARKAGKNFNISATLANHWAAYRKFLVWTEHFLGPDTLTLSARERELLILRTAWLCQAEYPWAQHLVIGRQAGVTDDEIACIKEGSAAAGWTPLDAALLCAADELHRDFVVSDMTWARLSEHYNTQQLMDAVFTVGHYHLVGMAVKSFGIQLDKGLEGF